MSKQPKHEHQVIEEGDRRVSRRTVVAALGGAAGTGALALLFNRLRGAKAVVSAVERTTGQNLASLNRAYEVLVNSGGVVSFLLGDFKRPNTDGELETAISNPLVLVDEGGKSGSPATARKGGPTIYLGSVTPRQRKSGYDVSFTVFDPVADRFDGEMEEYVTGRIAPPEAGDTPNHALTEGGKLLYAQHYPKDDAKGPDIAIGTNLQKGGPLTVGVVPRA